MNVKTPLSMLAFLMLAGASTAACQNEVGDATAIPDGKENVVPSTLGETGSETEVDAGSSADGGKRPSNDAGAPRDSGTPPQDAASPPPPPPPPPPVNVDWLGGTYSFYGKTENNVQFSSENRSVTFYPTTKTYSYALGRSSPSTGSFVPETTGIRFTNGPLLGKNIVFASDISPNCRVLRLNGATLSKSSIVAACPFVRAPLTPAECARRGTYTKTTSSGSIGSSGSGSESSFTTRISLERDRFYVYETSSTRRTCVQFECKSLRNDAADLVGSWALTGSTITGPNVTTAELAGFRFTPATGACP